MKISDELRDHLVEWLGANAIDVKSIPAEPRMTFADGELTSDVFMLDEQGHQMFAPGRDEIQRTVQTFEIGVPPPPDVAEWLRPRCPGCGR